MPGPFDDIGFEEDPAEGLDFAPDEDAGLSDYPDNPIGEYAPDGPAPGRELHSTVLDEIPIQGDVEGFAEPERPYGSGLTPYGRDRAQAARDELPMPDRPRVGRDFEGMGAASGAVDSALFGYADEIGGAARAPFTDRSYADERDALRGEMDAAREQEPGAFTAGGIGASLLTAPLMPAAGAGAATRAGRIAGAAATGFGYGALQGAGHSEGDVGSERFLDDTLEGGAIGGVTGGVIQGGGEAIGAGARALAARAPRLQARADEMRVLTGMGATGGTIARPRILREAQRVPGGVPEVARVMREQGMAPRFGSTGDVLEGAQSAAERSRSAITDIIEGVDDVGERIDIGAFADDLESQAQAFRTRPELDGVASALERKAALYRSRFPDGVSMRDAQTLVTDLGDRVNWVGESTGQLLPNAQQGAAAATRALRRQMDASAERAFSGQQVPQDIAGPYRDIIGDGSRSRTDEAGASALQAYRDARRVNQVSRIVEESAEESVGRAGKNRLFGLGESQAAAIGAAVTPGSPRLGAALGAGIRRGIAQRGAAARATAAETLAAVARSAPERLGRYAQSIANALQRGPQAYAAAYFVMSQQDPQFRQMVDELDAEEIE